MQAGHRFTCEENTYMFLSTDAVSCIKLRVQAFAWGASSLLGGAFLRAQTSPLSANDLVRVYVDSRRVTAPLDRDLLGSFLEHLGRAIYEGVYDPVRSYRTPMDFAKIHR